MYLFGRSASMPNGELGSSFYRQMPEACENGNYAKILGLIEQAKQADQKRVDINSRSTPFLNSLYENQLSRLVNEGEPVLTAAARGRFDIVLVLLQNGADPNVKDGSGKTILRFLVEQACRNQDKPYYVRQVKALIEAAQENPIQIDLTDTESFTPLMYSMFKQHSAMTQELRRYGARFSNEDKAVLNRKLIAENRIPIP